MAKVLKQFTVRQLKEPTDTKLGGDIEWLCNSLGFVSARDQDKTAFKIMRELIRAARHGHGMTSEEISRKVAPTQGAVIYHLKKFMKAGLVVKLGSMYELRMNSLYTTIGEIEKDMHVAMGNIKALAQEIDGRIGLDSRSLEEARDLF